MRAQPGRAEHRKSRRRQDENAEREQADQGAGEQHLADRVGRDQPFRGGVRATEHRARGDHQEDRKRNVRAPYMVGNGPCGGVCAHGLSQRQLCRWYHARGVCEQGAKRIPGARLCMTVRMAPRAGRIAAPRRSPRLTGYLLSIQLAEKWIVRLTPTGTDSSSEGGEPCLTPLPRMFLKIMSRCSSACSASLSAVGTSRESLASILFSSR